MYEYMYMYQEFLPADSGFVDSFDSSEGFKQLRCIAD